MASFKEIGRVAPITAAGQAKGAKLCYINGRWIIIKFNIPPHYKFGVRVNKIQIMDSQNNNAPGWGGSQQNMQSGANAGNDNVVMGVLAYIGPLVAVSYFVAKDNPFVKFHIKQGLVLLVIEVAVWLIGMILGQLWMLLNLINLATLILAIVGIINVTQGKEKELPIVGGYSHYFRI